MVHAEETWSEGVVGRKGSRKEEGRKKEEGSRK
jgi:hypothetical protein